MATPAQRIQRERRALKGFCAATIARINYFASCPAVNKIEKEELSAMRIATMKVLAGFDCSAAAAKKGK